MVPKNKFTTVWCRASTSKNMPAMKCQILPIGNWLTIWANQKELQSRFLWKQQFSMNFALTLGLSTIKTISLPSRKPLQPWESHGRFWMHPEFGFGKLANLPLESMDSHEYHLQAAGFFLVHGISHPILGSQMH